MSDLEDNISQQMRYYYKNRDKISLRQKEYNKQYYQDNKERIKQYQRTHRPINKKPQGYEYMRKWQIENKDKIRKYFHDYYMKNKEYYKEKNNNYYHDNNYKLYHREYYRKNKDRIHANKCKRLQPIKDAEKLKELDDIKNDMHRDISCLLDIFEDEMLFS
jgi:hypothetical protein